MQTCSDCTPTGPMTLALPSPAGMSVWTTPTMEKVLREAAPPTRPGDSIQIYPAKNEFEPFQVVLRPDAAQSATVSLSAFTGPGGGAAISRVEIHRVGYVRITTPSDAASIKSSFIPDPLEPTSFGSAESLSAGQNQPFWITVYVPKAATAGDYTATLTISSGGQSSDAPVRLHVYDFALPDRIGFDGNWNASMQALGGGASLAAVEQIKNIFFEHRLIPSSVAWPAGLNYNVGITYDCNTGQFVEKTSDPYDFSQLGPKYIHGTGWNGVGFQSFQIMQFVDNSTPRPTNV